MGVSLKGLDKRSSCESFDSFRYCVFKDTTEISICLLFLALGLKQLKGVKLFTKYINLYIEVINQIHSNCLKLGFISL